MKLDHKEKALLNFEYCIRVQSNKKFMKKAYVIML